MVHNGIISSVGGWSKKYSDTMEFVMEQVALIKEIDNEFYKNETALKLLFKLADSKLAFIDGEGHLSYVGEFIEDEGILYSNTSYKGYRRYDTKNLWTGNYDYTKSSSNRYDVNNYKSDKSRYVKFLDSSHWVLNENGDLVDNAYFNLVMDAFGALYELDYSDSDYGDERIRPILNHAVWYKLNDGSALEATFMSITSPGEWLNLVRTQVEKDNEEIAKLFLEEGKKKVIEPIN